MADTVDSTLPWVEKYRPASLDELISHEDIISTIQRFIEQDRFPHLLLYGPPGTGKTSTILACAKQMFTPIEYPSMVLELNASDDRGIGIVRNEIQNFAEARPVFSKTFKLIILDEADAMTNDAQNALRRIIEKYTRQTRFCIICNYLSKIIPAIQSRCTRFRFAPLQPDLIRPRLDYVIENEGVKAGKDGRDALLKLSGGDMRRVLNVLQCTHMSFGEVTGENVHRCCGQPTAKEMEEIRDALMDSTSIARSHSKIRKLQKLRGLALQDMLTRLHDMLEDMPELTEEFKCDLLEHMAEVEYQIASGGNERAQLGMLVCVFNDVSKAIWGDNNF